MAAETKPELAKIGMIGLAVMGENLALNIARNGFPIAVYNRDAAKVDKFLHRAEGKQVIGVTSIVGAVVGGTDSDDLLFGTRGPDVITAGLGVVNPLLIVRVFDNALFGLNNDCAGLHPIAGWSSHTVGRRPDMWDSGGWTRKRPPGT